MVDIDGVTLFIIKDKYIYDRVPSEFQKAPKVSIVKKKKKKNQHVEST